MRFHVFFSWSPYIELSIVALFHHLTCVMGNRKISRDLKGCALQLWELGHDLEFICESLCISQASMFQWRSIFDEFSSVNWPPSPLLRRLKIIIHAVMMAMYLDELIWWLVIHHNIVISCSALYKNLKVAGLT